MRRFRPDGRIDSDPGRWTGIALLILAALVSALALHIAHP